MNNQEFDHKIKSHFSKRTIQVSENAWDKLQLDSEVEKKSKAFVWFRVAAALVVLGVGLFYFNSKEENTVVVNPINKNASADEKSENTDINEQEYVMEEVEEKADYKKEIIKTRVKPVVETSIIVKATTNKRQQTQKSIKQVALKNSLPKEQLVVVNKVAVVEKPKAVNQIVTKSLIKQISESEENVTTFNNNKTKESRKIKTKQNKKIRKKIKIDALALMQTVENEIENDKEMRFRERMIFKVTESFSYVAQTFETD